jgi:hypothetical protein
VHAAVILFPVIELLTLQRFSKETLAAESLTEFLNNSVTECPELAVTFFDIVLSCDLALNRLDLLLRRINKHCGPAVQRVQVQVRLLFRVRLVKAELTGFHVVVSTENEWLPWTFQVPVLP